MCQVTAGAADALARQQTNVIKKKKNMKLHKSHVMFVFLFPIPARPGFTSQ